MKLTNKLLSLFLALLLAFSLTACGSDLESAVETAGEIIEVVDQVAQAVESLEETDVPEASTEETIIAESETVEEPAIDENGSYCLLYTSPSPRD